jgi:hypothetical protein
MTAQQTLDYLWENEYSPLSVIIYNLVQFGTLTETISLAIAAYYNDRRII